MTSLGQMPGSLRDRTFCRLWHVMTWRIHPGEYQAAPKAGRYPTLLVYAHQLYYTVNAVQRSLCGVLCTMVIVLACPAHAGACVEKGNAA